MGSITRRDFMGLSAGVGAFAALGLAGCSVSAGTSGSTQKPGTVKLGVDVLEGDFGILSGKKVGLITNATGVDSKFASTIDVLHASANLTTLFAPEHGIRGAVDAGGTVGQDTDAKTGLPVYSLYGNTKKPTDDMLARSTSWSTTSRTWAAATTPTSTRWPTAWRPARPPGGPSACWTGRTPSEACSWRAGRSRRRRNPSSAATACPRGPG